MVVIKFLIVSIDTSLIKLQKLKKNLPHSTIDPMSYYEKHITKHENTFALKTINMSQLRIQMSKIKNTNSADIYGLSMAMIMKIRKVVEPIILRIINLSIQNNIFPECLKISKIIPIPKGVDYINLNNYRGVNILSPISRIIEKVWASQMLENLYEKNLIANNHQGGLKKRGTQNATLVINIKRNKIIESNKFAAIITLDQSACYDIISHEILIKKMKHIGFNDNTIELLKEYFKQRKQYVEINSISSQLLVVGNRSVQQGSVLSTLFYTIFMLDLPIITHEVIHNNHFEEFNCKKEFMVTFIDDVFAVIEGERNNIWIRVENYIKKWKLIMWQID